MRSGMRSSFLLALCILTILVMVAIIGCEAEITPAPEISTSPNVNKISTTLPRPSSALPPPSVRFEHLSVEDGLAHSEVWAIAQDPLGFLWFGTQNGLCKYDGYSFTTYRHNPNDDGSLRDNYILSLFVDSGGTLWVDQLRGRAPAGVSEDSIKG